MTTNGTAENGRSRLVPNRAFQAALLAESRPQPPRIILGFWRRRHDIVPAGGLASPASNHPLESPFFFIHALGTVSLRPTDRLPTCSVEPIRKTLPPVLIRLGIRTEAGDRSGFASAPTNSTMEPSTIPTIFSSQWLGAMGFAPAAGLRRGERGASRLPVVGGVSTQPARIPGHAG